MICQEIIGQRECLRKPEDYALAIDDALLSLGFGA